MFALVAMECKSGERGHKQYSHIITKFLKYDVFGSNKFRKCLIDHARVILRTPLHLGSFLFHVIAKLTEISQPSVLSVGMVGSIWIC